MTYQRVIDYLYNQLPAFERQGAGGYKPGLGTSVDLDDLFGNPHRAYPTVHVAGTNGKGSTAHMIAAILQKAGLKVGLYTSPHIVDFRERIRVNGKMIAKKAVTDFMDRYFATGYEGHPSFFELTSTMAMDYFRQRGVDIAVIEVGLGGRLDSTNIITPVLSVITNVSLDHTQFLGSTLREVATEKAGIIKPHVPVVAGDAEGDVRDVITRVAQERKSPLTIACDTPMVTSHEASTTGLTLHTPLGTLQCQLGGDYQARNVNTVLHAVQRLREAGFKISDRAIAAGLREVATLTGLIGRWMTIGTQPTVICDSGHNIGAFTATAAQLKALPCKRLHIILGFMADKDISPILPLLPRDAKYYFTQAHTSRALAAEALRDKATTAGLEGEAFDDVKLALKTAKAQASPDDAIFVGGSMYVLAELLTDY